VRTILIERGSTPKDAAHKIKAAAGGPVKVAIECTGVESSVHTAIHVRNNSEVCHWQESYDATQAMQFGGKVFIIGVGKDEQVVCKMLRILLHLVPYNTPSSRTCT
jgi:L-iditol 2-dehydrogenase